MEQKQTIHISSSVGKGPTELSAFDNALMLCGVHNMNIIPLSSVIPPSANLIEHEGPLPALPGSWGDRLYVVHAEMRTSTPGVQVWAGIGWVRDEATKEGLFVEHHADSEAELRELITRSLQGLMANRNRDFGQIHMRISGAVCDGEPTCVYTVAAYQVSDWQNQAYQIN